MTEIKFPLLQGTLAEFEGLPSPSLSPAVSRRAPARESACGFHRGAATAGREHRTEFPSP